MPRDGCFIRAVERVQGLEVTARQGRWLRCLLTLQYFSGGCMLMLRFVFGLRRTHFVALPARCTVGPRARVQRFPDVPPGYIPRFPVTAQLYGNARSPEVTTYGKAEIKCMLAIPPQIYQIKGSCVLTLSPRSLKSFYVRSYVRISLPLKYWASW